MDISIRKTRPVRVPRKRLQALGEALLEAEGWPVDAGVDLWFCSDDEIQRLNREHREKDHPTDVLSFSQYAPGERPNPALPVALGDVVMSVDTVARQAAERDAAMAEEIVWLWLHSLLHLIGYDDETEEGAAEMDARAHEVLSGRSTQLLP
jgi:probable rRNA maturation factor